MTVEDTQEAAGDEPSKSQRKRDADVVRQLGATLAALGESERATIPLSDEVRAAIDEYNRIHQRGARKRQLGFLAKRLRQIDLGPVELALERLRQITRSQTDSLHRVEHWRNRLLGEVDSESSSEALTAFIENYPSADRQQMRQLQRRSLAEHEAGRPPAHARQLFRLIRDLVVPSIESDASSDS
ncbi:MAG: ribosome biogenesis factor YjgA [Granulosicoccus sp.]